MDNPQQALVSSAKIRESYVKCRVSITTQVNSSLVVRKWLLNSSRKGIVPLMSSRTPFKFLRQKLHCPLPQPIHRLFQLQRRRATAKQVNIKVKESSFWFRIFVRNLESDDLGRVSPTKRNILFYSSHGIPGISNRYIWSNGKHPWFSENTDRLLCACFEN